MLATNLLGVPMRNAGEHPFSAEDDVGSCDTGCGSDSQGRHKAACLVPAPHGLGQGHKAPAPHHTVLPGERWQHDLPAALPEAAGALPGLLHLCAQVRLQMQHLAVSAPQQRTLLLTAMQMQASAMRSPCRAVRGLAEGNDILAPPTPSQQCSGSLSVQAVTHSW